MARAPLVTPAVGMLFPFYYYIVFAGPAPMSFAGASAGMVSAQKRQGFVCVQRQGVTAHVAPMCANDANDPQKWFPMTFGFVRSSPLR